MSTTLTIQGALASTGPRPIGRGEITDLSFSTAAMAKLYLNNGTAGLIVQKVYPLP